MSPEPLSLKSDAVKVDAPLVVPSATALFIASVVPVKVNGPETVAVWTAPTPLPTKMPVSDVEPVPPYATEKEEVAETSPFTACRGPFCVPTVRLFV